MRIKIIIPILSLLVAIIVGFLYFSFANKNVTKQYRDYILVKVIGSRYKYEFPFEKGTKVFDIVKILNVGSTESIEHIYKKRGSAWQEIGLNDKIEKDQTLKLA